MRATQLWLRQAKTPDHTTKISTRVMPAPEGGVRFDVTYAQTQMCVGEWIEAVIVEFVNGRVTRAWRITFDMDVDVTVADILREPNIPEGFSIAVPMLAPAQ